MDKLKITDTDKLVICIILAVNLILNLVYGFNTSSAGFGGILLGIVDTLVYTAYIMILNTPVIATAVVMLGQVVTAVYILLAGATFIEAVEDGGLAIAISFLAFAIHYTIANKHVDKSLNKKEKFVANLLYNRKIYNIKWYYKIMLYSLMVISVMALSNTTGFDNIEGAQWKAFGALAVMLPMFKMLSILSTTTLAYEFMGITILIEIFTLYIVGHLSNLNWLQICYTITELFVLGYCMYKLYKLRVKNREKIENEKKH